jgi:glycosyltransferase involved in cell wall biosynthesis
MTQDNKVIGFVNSAKTWGGGEKWHYEAALDLQQRGYRVWFFCQPGSELETRLHAAQIATMPLSISNLSFLNLGKILHLKQSFVRLEIHTLLINSPTDAKTVALAANLADVPKVILRRGMSRPISRNFFNNWLFRNAVHRVIANSQAVADSLDTANGGVVPGDKISIIENGMAFDDTTEVIPLNLDTTAPIIIGSAGRMVKQKNQRFLIDVASGLREQKLDFQMIIAGTGKLETELKQAAEDKGLSSCILFPGFVDNIRGLHTISDIFLLPSLYEGSPNTLIEAAGYGLSVVASDIPPNREILPDNAVGRLVPLNDTEGFCLAIIELANDATLREDIGAAAKARVRDKFNLQRAREKLIALL